MIYSGGQLGRQLCFCADLRPVAVSILHSFVVNPFHLPRSFLAVSALTIFQQRLPIVLSSVVLLVDVFMLEIDLVQYFNFCLMQKFPPLALSLSMVQ